MLRRIEKVKSTKRGVLETLRKLDNVAEGHKKEFRRRIKNLRKEIRPVVKALSKDNNERTKEDIDLLMNFFVKIPVFSSLKISNSDLAKGVSMIECLWMPQEKILF